MKKTLLGTFVFLFACFNDRTRVERIDSGESDTEISVPDAGTDLKLDIDETRFQVVSTSPEIDATMVSRTGIISVTLNKSVSLNSIAFTLSDSSGGVISGEVIYDDNLKAITFSPDITLDMFAKYTARLGADTNDFEENPLGADFAWTFETTDGNWTNGVLVETNNVGEAVNPDVAFDNEGNAVVVWSQSDEQDLFSIWFNRFDGMTWNGTDLVENENVLSAVGPTIKFDAKGKATALWSQQEKGLLLFPYRTDIWASRFDANWGNSVRISGDNDGNKGSFQLSIDGSGKTSALLSPPAPAFGFSNKTTVTDFDANVWGESFTVASSGQIINGGGIFVAKNAFFAVNKEGKVLVVWENNFTGGDATSERWNIYSRYFDGNDWSESVLVETDDAGDAGAPQVTFANTGSAIAVWEQSDGTRKNIWANRFDGTKWGNAERIERDDEGDAEKPQVLFDDNGNATVVWIQSDGIDKNVWANRFDGSRWGDATLIETEGDDVSKLQLAVDSRGHAIVVWVQNENIWANRFTATEKSWGSATLLEMDDAGPANDPAIDIDPNGNAFVVWSQSDGTRSNIWAIRFE